jgi:hypothetical protein
MYWLKLKITWVMKNRKKIVLFFASIVILSCLLSLSSAQKKTTTVEPGRKVTLDNGWICYCNEGSTCGCVKVSVSQ